MYQECREEGILHKFWLDERLHSPRWLNDSSGAWHCSWEDFKDFCDKCHKIYLINDVALIYVEVLGDSSNIHFSLIRGANAYELTSDFIAIRDEILQTSTWIYGYVGKHNRGLKRIMETVGFYVSGLEMLFGQSHGKVLEWECLAVSKMDCKTSESLVIS